MPIVIFIFFARWAKYQVMHDYVNNLIGFISRNSLTNGLLDLQIVQ